MRKPRVELGLAEAALLFGALGDATRLALVRMLSDGGPASIAALAGSFEVSRQAVTKHLRSLEAAGLIEGRRSGREHVWALNPSRLAEARKCLEAIGRGWDEALARLREQVEQG